jgi:hypothetical protein
MELHLRVYCKVPLHFESKERLSQICQLSTTDTSDTVRYVRISVTYCV